MSSTGTLPTFADILAARDLIAPFVHRTPVVTSATLDELTGARLFFKAENLQRTGAFKYRGATNAVQLLGGEQASRGVATHSSGNHGAALARAAAERGIRAWIVMPRGSRPVKRRAVEAYGGTVIECEPTQLAREMTAARVCEETGATLVPPYDDPAIVSGQGTAALELVEEVADLDMVVAPLGGGGLVGGTAIVVRAISAAAAVIGVEPTGADDARQSLEAGRLVTLAAPNTVADGLRATIGHLNLALLREHDVRVVSVDDATIIDATHLLAQRLKLVVEPSGAVPLAALLAGRLDVRDRRVGLILSGGNIELGLA